MLFSMTVIFEWRGALRNEEINQLHAAGFDHTPEDEDWIERLSRLSLGWVTARDEQGLVGLVNVIWDGSVHAFIQDTLVAHRARRQGIGKKLLSLAAERSRAAGLEWLHVDFDDHLKSFTSTHAVSAPPALDSFSCASRGRRHQPVQAVSPLEEQGEGGFVCSSHLRFRGLALGGRKRRQRGDPCDQPEP